ncbi:hypothetical protein SISNIDRAFT_414141, partial [Sistotremastrum niveocremeum HHB9708]
IALFSAIVTAFLLPIIQNLTPVPGQDTDALLASLIDVIIQIASMNGLSVPDVKPPPPFQAADSDEISAFFWYSSLIVSVSDILFEQYPNPKHPTGFMCWTSRFCTFPNAGY